MANITVKVTGMTCQHCVAHVTEELENIESVESVSVNLDPKGVSEVSVTATGEVSDAQLCEAVDEAGYEVSEIQR